MIYATVNTGSSYQDKNFIGIAVYRANDAAGARLLSIVCSMGWHTMV